MIYLLDKAFQIVLVIICLIVFLGLVLLGLYIASKSKKKGKQEEDEYYQDLERKDAQSYLDVEDITDDMAYYNHHRTFVGYIRCNSGIDLSSASSQQVSGTMQAYIEFLSSIRSPITLLQLYVPMSMDYTLNMYHTRYQEVERELYHKNEDRKALVDHLNMIKGVSLVEEEALIEEIDKIQKEISNIEWERLHLQDQIDFMTRVCSEQALEPAMEQYYVFEWHFAPGRYSMELTEEQIHVKAMEELDAMANRMISALAKCSVHAYRCKTSEIIELFYKQGHPLSSMEFKMPDIQNSPYFDTFVTSKDHKRKLKQAQEDAMIAEGVRLGEALDAFAMREDLGNIAAGEGAGA